MSTSTFPSDPYIMCLQGNSAMPKVFEFTIAFYQGFNPQETLITHSVYFHIHWANDVFSNRMKIISKSKIASK